MYKLYYNIMSVTIQSALGAEGKEPLILPGVGLNFQGATQKKHLKWTLKDRLLEGEGGGGVVGSPGRKIVYAMAWSH